MRERERALTPCAVGSPLLHPQVVRMSLVFSSLVSCADHGIEATVGALLESGAQCCPGIESSTTTCPG